jgi:hypothetical protein
LLDSSLVLFHMIIQVAVRTMLHGFPEFGFDRAGIGIMPVGRNALRNTAGDDTGGPKERFRRGSVPLLA